MTRGFAPTSVGLLTATLALASLAVADVAHGRALAPFVSESPDTSAVLGGSCAIEIDETNGRPLLFYSRTDALGSRPVRLEHTGRRWLASELELLTGATVTSTTRVHTSWLVDTTFPAEVVSQVTAALASALAVDHDGRLHVVFADSDGVHYARSDAHVAMELIDGASAGKQRLSIRVDAEGRPHVAYHAGDQTRYATRDASWTIETLGPGDEGESPSASLRLTSSDAPVIAFTTTLDDRRRVVLATRVPGGFERETVDDADSPVACALALDACDTPHVAYTVLERAAARVRYATRAVHSLNVVTGYHPSLEVRVGPGVTSLTARARRGGDSIFTDPVPLTDEDGDGVFSGAFDPHLTSVRGLEIYIESGSRDAALGSSDAPVRWPLPSSMTLQPTDAPTPRFVAAPLEVHGREDARTILDAALEGAPWRVTTWDTYAGEYHDVTELEPSAFEPGRGYWVSLPADRALTLEGHSSFPPDARDDFEIPLRPGWNAVGNPAAYTISLDPEDVRIQTPVLEKSFARAAIDGQVRGTIFTFDASNVDSAGYRFDRRTLGVWEGGWIKNETAATLTMRIPARALSPDAATELERLAVSTPLAWRLELAARTSTERTSVALAFAARGERHIDMLDIYMPPMPPDRTLGMAIRHSGDIITDGPVPLYRDVRSAAVGEADWLVHIASEEEPVELRWDTPTRDPSQTYVPVGTLTLVDPRGNEWDMSATRSVVLPPGEHELRVTARAEPGAATGPMAFDALIRPNPFRSETTFHYELPQAGAVRLGVFDITGRLVWSHDQESASAGGHAVYWDGHDVRAQRVQPGTYFLRVVRDVEGRAGETLTRKITVLP